ncbi:DUF4136 domain-containing protein [Galbibacter sp.]|jgi:hypothetical protein|uniref:DUF4136 domain-containing protein n=1 Tax=Galbibacter sp. TaxID=2918471 RepID=UPI003A8E0A9E
MKIRVAVIVLCLLVAGCGIQVAYDYDNNFDFSEVQTYNYYPSMSSGLSQLDEKRLLRSVDSLMHARGFKTSESPDLFINIKSSSRPKPVNSAVGIGIGGTNRNIGGGVSVGIPVDKQDQYREIIFDIIDVMNDDLIWQAVSETTISESMTPLVREAKMKAVVDKVFSKYPPR